MKHVPIENSSEMSNIIELPYHRDICFKHTQDLSCQKTTELKYMILDGQKNPMSAHLFLFLSYHMISK